MVLELKRNIVEGKEEIKTLEMKNTALEKESIEIKKKINEKDILLRCVICMEKARDTVVLPCLHFLFCSTCIQKHNSSSNTNKCPSCRQTTTGNLNCRLEGERPIGIANNSNKRKKSDSDEEQEEKNGNGKKRKTWFEFISSSFF